MESPYRIAIDELGAVLDRIDDSAVDRVCQMIADASQVVVFGLGREGLQIRGFAMRLFHLGRKASVVGDMTAPPIGPGDLFLVTVGPGELPTALALLDVAKRAGATIVLLTAQPTGRAARYADFVLVIPAQTMADDLRLAASAMLPMGSLYEGSLFIVFEVMIAKLRSKLGISFKAMRANHTNLE
jgi:6-phospho-3-hexuloisomerase